MRMVASMLIAVAVAGCATTDTVVLQNPQTHEIVRCAEGHRSFIEGNGYKTQEECIADYEKQGFERARTTPAK